MPLFAASLMLLAACGSASDGQPDVQEGEPDPTKVTRAGYEEKGLNWPDSVGSFGSAEAVLYDVPA